MSASTHLCEFKYKFEKDFSLDGKNLYSIEKVSFKKNA